ncbi:hypothetical protein F5B20DRAFT_179425 [Whalleya microplaca]|nr:hypothetical protein F5B20DRAFT_179425 [Whalleya microplaca]
MRQLFVTTYGSIRPRPQPPFLPPSMQLKTARAVNAQHWHAFRRGYQHLYNQATRSRNAATPRNMTTAPFPKATSFACQIFASSPLTWSSDPTTRQYQQSHKPSPRPPLRHHSVCAVTRVNVKVFRTRMRNATRVRPRYKNVRCKRHISILGSNQALISRVVRLVQLSLLKINTNGGFRGEVRRGVSTGEMNACPRIVTAIEDQRAGWCCVEEKETSKYERKEY